MQTLNIAPSAAYGRHHEYTARSITLTTWDSATSPFPTLVIEFLGGRGAVNAGITLSREDVTQLRDALTAALS